MSKRQQTLISVKYEAIMEIERESLSKTELAKKIGVPLSTLSCWLTSKDSILDWFESSRGKCQANEE